MSLHLAWPPVTDQNLKLTTAIQHLIHFFSFSRVVEVGPQVRDSHPTVVREAHLAVDQRLLVLRHTRVIVLERSQMFVAHVRLPLIHDDRVDVTSLLNLLTEKRSVTVFLERMSPRIDLIVLLS